MLPTPRTTHGHADLALICSACARTAYADLAALIASGRGDVPLRELRFVCSACGSRRVDVRVTGARGIGVPF